MSNSSSSDNNETVTQRMNIPSSFSNMPFCGQMVLVPHIAMASNGQMVPFSQHEQLTAMFRTSTYQVTSLRGADPDEDKRRMVAMDSTIKHLKSLLKNEMEDRQEESQKVANLKADLSAQKQEVEELKSTLQATEDKVEHVEEEKLMVEKSLEAVQKELLDLKEELNEVKDERLDLEKTVSELRQKLSENYDNHQAEKLNTEIEIISAQNISLKSANENLIEELSKLMCQFEQHQKELNSKESTLHVLRNEHYAVQEKLMQGAQKIESQNIIIKELKSKLNILVIEKNNFEKILIERENKLRRICGTMAREIETLKSPSDDVESLKAAKIKKDTLFKELAQKHVFMIEYAGEKMYEEVLVQHDEFLKKLTTTVQNYGRLDSANEEAFNKTIDCVQSQMAVIRDFQIAFKERVEKAMRMIEKDTALLSDLNFRALLPKLETPIDRFESLLSYFESLE